MTDQLHLGEAGLSREAAARAAWDEAWAAYIACAGNHPAGQAPPARCTELHDKAWQAYDAWCATKEEEVAP